MKDRIEQLEKELAELKAELSEEEFEEGGWAVPTENLLGFRGGVPVRLIERDKGDNGWLVEQYGSESMSGKAPYVWYHKDSLRPATEGEIKEALIAEAKRRGLVKGAKARQRHDEYDKTIEDRLISDKYEYDSSRDVLYVRPETMIGVWVYRCGQWAELVGATPSIEVNGHTAEFHEDYVEFGCARIGSYMFEDLSRLIKDNLIYQDSGPTGNRGVTGIKIGRGVFTLEQIKQIAKYYQEE